MFNKLPDISIINSEIENELRPALSPDEKFIWTGKPQTGLKLRNSDVFLIPFSLLWGGFAIFWETSVLSIGAAMPMGLFGIPFVLMGLYLMVGRFFLDAKIRANTVYGITTDRVIIKTGLFNKEIKSLNIKTLSDISINQNADNTGTITLGPTDARNAIMQGIEWPGVKQTPRLEFIDDVKNVYDKIIALQRQK